MLLSNEYDILFFSKKKQEKSSRIFESDMNKNQFLINFVLLFLDSTIALDNDWKQLFVQTSWYKNSDIDKIKYCLKLVFNHVWTGMTVL